MTESATASIPPIPVYAGFRWDPKKLDLGCLPDGLAGDERIKRDGNNLILSPSGSTVIPGEWVIEVGGTLRRMTEHDYRESGLVNVGNSDEG